MDQCDRILNGLWLRRGLRAGRDVFDLYRWVSQGDGRFAARGKVRTVLTTLTQGAREARERAERLPESRPTLRKGSVRGSCAMSVGVRAFLPGPGLSGFHQQERPTHPWFTRVLLRAKTPASPSISGCIDSHRSSLTFSISSSLRKKSEQDPYCIAYQRRSLSWVSGYGGGNKAIPRPTNRGGMVSPISFTRCSLRNALTISPPYKPNVLPRLLADTFHPVDD